MPTATSALAQAQWEQHLAEQIQFNPAVPATEKPPLQAVAGLRVE
jgi:hypothetical protein